MIDIASLNSNLPTYFEALDSSNSNTNQSLLPDNRNERLPPQNGMGVQNLLPNNNIIQTIPNTNPPTNVLQPQPQPQPQPTLIPSNPIMQQSAIPIQNNTIQQSSNPVYSNTIINTNMPSLPNQMSNQMNPPEIFSQPSQPSPYSNNTIVSPLNGISLSNPSPQYVVVNKNMTPTNSYVSYPNASPPNMTTNMNSTNTSMNILPTPANNTVVSPLYQSTSNSSVMLPPTLMRQNTMNHAYSAPVFSNTLSPPSLPNQDANAGLPINIPTIPSNNNTPIISTPHGMSTTPIISNPLTTGILPTNISTPIISNNTTSNIIPTELSTPVISKELGNQMEMATPIVMNASMPVITSEMATPIQSSTTPAFPSTLFTINSNDSTLANTNNTLVISSDVNSSIILESPQVNSLDSLSPPNKMSSMVQVPQTSYAMGTPVTKMTMDGLTPPTNTRTLRFDGETNFQVRSEEVPLMNVGATPSTRTNEFINSLPTPTDSFTMKCTMNKEGITLDSIAENTVSELNKPIMPISPKEELSKLAGGNGNGNVNGSGKIIANNGTTLVSDRNTSTILSNASYPSPQTVNKKGLVREAPTSSSSTQLLNQPILTEEPTPLHPMGMMNTAMPTPMPTPLNAPISNTSYINPITTALPTPMTTSREMETTLPMNGLSQDRRRRVRVVKKNNKYMNKHLSSPAALSTLSSVINSLKAQINPDVPIISTLKSIQEVSTVNVSSKLMAKTEPTKFTEPLSKNEYLTLTEPQCFVDPINNTAVNKSEVKEVEKEEEKSNSNTNSNSKSEILTYTDLLEEASIQQKHLSFNDLLIDNISSKTIVNHRIRNYTEPLPFTDPLVGDEMKDDILTLDDLLAEASIQNKKVTYNDLLTEGSNVSVQSELQKKTMEMEMEIDNNKKIISESESVLSNPATHVTTTMKKDNENISKSVSSLENKKSSVTKNSTSIKASSKTIALIESIRKEFTFKKQSKADRKEKKVQLKSIKKENVVSDANQISKEKVVVSNNVKQVNPKEEVLPKLKEIKKEENEKVECKKGNEVVASVVGNNKRKEDEMVENTTNSSISTTTTTSIKKMKTDEKVNVESKDVKMKENKSVNTTEETKTKTTSTTKSSKKRSNEEGSKEEGVVKKRKYNKDGSEQKRKNKESKHKDVSETGIINKVKYNSNNISLYDSELKSLLKYQTKNEEDVYPLRCICEGDYDEKDATLGLEDLVCSYPNCNKVFNKSIHLEKHFIEHGEDFRPFQCPNCTKNFRRRYDLMRHIRIHNYIIPYRCSRCLRGFTRSDSCARHTKTRQCKYFDFKNLGMKKDQPPYYSVVKDPEQKTEKEIVIVPLNKGSQ
eukprot:jgi/Orpsp1_1/1174816/evm.model.c7180000051548.1